MTTETIYEKSQGVFLNLSTCGSSIRWGVSVEVYTHPKEKQTVSFDFKISMTDCSRTVSWDADCDVVLARKKLTRAITSFQSALAAIDQAEMAMKRKNKEISR